MTSARFTAIVLAGAMSLVGCGRASEGPGDSLDQSRSPQPGSRAAPAPDFSIETFDGDRFRLSEQRGTPVVINFWESW
jgi:hypothetical protein